MSVNFMKMSFDVKFEGKNVLKMSEKCGHCKREIRGDFHSCSVCKNVVCDACLASVRSCPGCKESIIRSTSSQSGPIPIPYPNFSGSSAASKGSKKVRM